MTARTSVAEERGPAPFPNSEKLEVERARLCGRYDECQLNIPDAVVPVAHFHVRSVFHCLLAGEGALSPMDARPVRGALADREQLLGVLSYSGLRQDFLGQYCGAEANISAVS